MNGKRLSVREVGGVLVMGVTYQAHAAMAMAKVGRSLS